MNEIYINIIIIFIIIVLFLAYILIAYFYSNYTDYKTDVNNNLKKTTTYINDTTTTLSSNITAGINKTDAVKSELTNKINSNLSISSNLFNTANTNITSINSNMNIDISNLNNFDTSLKNYFEFKDNDRVISDKLFNYRFGAIPDTIKSLNIIKNVTAVSGMTVKTDANNLMKICDLSTINSSNCMNMNISESNFNIFPTISTASNNNISNINIYNKDKSKILAQFNIDNNDIYLGGTGENAAAVIQDNNIYFKNINLLNTKIDKITNQKILPTFANKSLANSSKFDADGVNTIYGTMFEMIRMYNTINGVYTIKRTIDPTDPTKFLNSIIINFKTKPNLGITANSVIIIDIIELNKLISPSIINNTSIEITINPTILSTPTFSASLNSNQITLRANSDIPINTNVRIKITDVLIVIPENIKEDYITNTFSGTFN